MLEIPTEADEERAEEREFVDSDERVCEIMDQVVSGGTEVGIEERQEDIDERSSVKLLPYGSHGVRCSCHSTKVLEK